MFLKCKDDKDCLKQKFIALLANHTVVVLNKPYYEIPIDTVKSWLSAPVNGGKSRRKGRKSRRKFRKSKNRRKKLTKKMV